MTDVKITPASRKVEFFGSDDALDAAISTDASGNLSITNVGGEISLGDTTADIHIGDGTNSVDLVFDQAGSIYSVSGQQLTLGSTTGGSTAVDSTLYLNGWTYVDVAGQNLVLRSDTIERGTLEFQQGTTRRWVLNLEADGDLNFQASDSADLFRVQGNRVLTTGDEGSGNGLDADTLDGYDESTFMRRSANSHLNMNNYTLQNVNDITFNDPGPNEGLKWNGGNDWRFYESPDDLTTNTGGNLQFVTGTSRRATLNTSGSLWTSSQGTLWGASNDGPGSGLDADTLDGVQGSSFLRSDASDTLTSGTLSVDGKIKINSSGSFYLETSASGGYIPRPKGGHYITATASNIGAIQIALPTNGNSDMISFHVDIYDYTTDESVSLFISGYQNSSVGGDTWVNCEARVLTTNSFKNYTVRFGDNGSVPVVWIGETNDSWSYPQVLVRDLQVGYTADVDNWDDGWAISFVASFGTVNETQTNNWPVASYATTAGTASDANQLGGYLPADYIRNNTFPTLFGLTINSAGTTLSKDLYNDLIIKNTGTGTDDGIILSTYGSSSQRTALKAFGGTNSYITGYYNGYERLRTHNDGVTITGYMWATNGIAHEGDSDTYFEFSDDRIQIFAGLVEMLDMVEGTTDYVDIIDRVRVTANGDMICEGDITAYTTTSVSDERRKDNIQVIDNALDKVSQLKGITFNWKHNGSASAGLIAQDVEKVLPEVVSEKEIRDEGTYKTVDYDGIIGLLVESIKELKAEIEVLKNAPTK